MQEEKEKNHTICEILFDKCEVLDRIKLYYNLKGNAELARLLGVAPNTITNWYGRNTFDIDRIYTNCVGVNFHWLLTGDGEMSISDINKQQTKTDIEYQSDPRDTKLIESKNETIETQRELINTLKQRILELERGGLHSSNTSFQYAQSAASTGEISQKK